MQNRVMLILHAGHCGKQVSNALMALRIINPQRACARGLLGERSEPHTGVFNRDFA